MASTEDPNLYSWVYEGTLMNILLSVKKIVPFLDVIFRFLYNHTDFYDGFEPGEAERIVMSTFKFYEKLAIERRQTRNAATAMIKTEQPDDVMEITPPSNEEPLSQNIKNEEKSPSSNDLQDEIEKEMTTSNFQNVKNIDETSSSQQNTNDNTTTANLQSKPGKVKDLWELIISQKTCSPTKHITVKDGNRSISQHGSDGINEENYSWVQTAKEVDIFIYVKKSEDLFKRNIKVKITNNSLAVKVYGQVILRVHFFAAISKTNSWWIFRPRDTIHVKVIKIEEKVWPRLLER